MKQYVGLRPTEEAIDLFEKEGWRLNFEAYDRGGDFILLENEPDTIRFCWSPFNGHLFGETIGGKKFSHDSAEFDGTPFYEDIMNKVYLTQEVAQ